MENKTRKIMKWLQSVLSADGDVSSKRVVGFGSFLLLCILVIYHVFTGKEVQAELIWSLVALITACFGLNAIIDVKAMTSRSSVATQLAKSNTTDPAASKAQELVETVPETVNKKEEAVG